RVEAVPLEVRRRELERGPAAALELRERDGRERGAAGSVPEVVLEVGTAAREPADEERVRRGESLEAPRRLPALERREPAADLPDLAREQAGEEGRAGEERERDQRGGRATRSPAGGAPEALERRRPARGDRLAREPALE